MVKGLTAVLHNAVTLVSTEIQMAILICMSQVSFPSTVFTFTGQSSSSCHGGTLQSGGT